MTATRRLAAIMAVDVVGYSRLMGEDEAGTALSVREHREAARPILAALGGRIVKTMGDGLLLEFPSVVAAVECAIAIQKLMAERNADTPEAKRIVYRIGVSLGDVLIEGDDILGDGVNIAARLEGICEPGQVLISSTASKMCAARSTRTSSISARKWRGRNLALDISTPRSKKAARRSTPDLRRGSLTSVWPPRTGSKANRRREGGLGRSAPPQSETQRQMDDGEQVIPNYSQPWSDALRKAGLPEE